MKLNNLKISDWQSVLFAVSILIFGAFFAGCRGSRFELDSTSQFESAAALEDSDDAGSKGEEDWLQTSNDTEAGVTPLPNSNQPFDVPGYPVSVEFTKRVPDRFQFQPVDEVWVFAESSDQIVQQAGNSRDEDQNIVSILVTDPSDLSKWVPLPINSFQVNATVQDIYASVKSRQSYHNPYHTPTEALYIFVLPENSVVDEFSMTIGERAVRGIIRKREEAEQIYQEMRRQGYEAAMMTQVRSNIFSHRIASIKPGDELRVDIQYFHKLRDRDGWKEMVFPKVFDPRYSDQQRENEIATEWGQPYYDPANSSSSPMSDVVHKSPHSETGILSRVVTEFNIELLPSVPWKEIVSPTHEIEVSSLENGHKRIGLKNSEELMKRDFKLRLKPKAEELTAATTTHRVGNETFLGLSIYPPESGGKIAASINTPLEMIFVLDCSDSMRGQPLEQAKKAVRFVLETLTENDSFQLIRFSDTSELFGQQPLTGTQENIKRGLVYLERLYGVGGEQMTHGLLAALNFPRRDEERLRFVCLMTDGRLGNEADLLREVKTKIGAARVFSFGVGSSPNRFLLNRLALAGRGAAAFLGYDDDPDLVMQNFISHIRGAALTDLELDWNVTSDNVEFYPSILPDVFVGRSIHLLARIQGPPPETILLTGKQGGIDYSTVIETVIESSISSTTANPLTPLWARARIADLSESMVTANSWETIQSTASQIRSTALTHNLLSPLTSYEIIDSPILSEEGEFEIEDSAPDLLDEDTGVETSGITK